MGETEETSPPEWVERVENSLREPARPGSFTPPRAPATEQDPDTEYPCSACGRPLTYGGAGRKPKRCTDRNGGDPECYGSRKSSGARTGRAASNDKLAQQATDVLVSLDGC